MTRFDRTDRNIRICHWIPFFFTENNSIAGWLYDKCSFGSIGKGWMRLTRWHAMKMWNHYYEVIKYLWWTDNGSALSNIPKKRCIKENVQNVKEITSENWSIDSHALKLIISTCIIPIQFALHWLDNRSLCFATTSLCLLSTLQFTLSRKMFGCCIASNRLCNLETRGPGLNGSFQCYSGGPLNCFKVECTLQPLHNCSFCAED